MRFKNFFTSSRQFLLLIILGFISLNTFVNASEEADERSRAKILEKAAVNLYFYPINRLLDLQDVLHFGIAGSLGLGAEFSMTEKASFGAYYTAKENGIAYHGHRKRLSWLDSPPTPISPIKLIPGLDEKQRRHEVKYGYSTASFGATRYESEKDEKLHFKRFENDSGINELNLNENELEEEQRLLINKIDESLHKGNEAAIRTEVVAGLVHPYMALRPPAHSSGFPGIQQ